jgi:ABC-2 type transport system permease protein
MRTILSLVRKDFLNFRRNKAALSLTFAVPFAMIWLFGIIFNVDGRSTGPSGIAVGLANASTNPGATKLIEALKKEKSFRLVTEFKNPDGTLRPLTEADLRPLMQAPGAPFRFALSIPADLVSEKTFGLHLKFFSNPANDIETQMVNGILQKTIFSNVPELLGQSLQARAKQTLGEKRLETLNGGIASAVSGAFGGDKAEIERRIAAGDFGLGQLTKSSSSNTATAASGEKSSSSASDVFSQIVRIESEQVVGAKVKNPMATRLVGGWAIQFLLFAVSASAASLFRERDAGIFQRLLAAPVTRTQILLSKFIYGVVLGLFQLVVLFLASSILYGTEVLPHIVLLSIVCLFAAAACTSFGMLLASLSSSPEAASGLATFVIMLMSALGGAWFPISMMPAFIQQFSKLTLVYWAMEGFSAVLWAGQSFLQVLPLLGILGGITALVMGIAVWRFNKGNIFG